MALTRNADAVAPVRSSGPIAAINLVVKNARSISGGWDNALDFSVFLKQELTESEAEALGRLMEQRGNTAASMALLHEELENLPETEYVQVDTEWVQRFHAILDIVRQAILIGAALLSIAIIVIIGNTIRLDIENRRDEIEVTKLIGASNAFVRRPFLWTGFWYGLFGGLMALALVYYGLFLLQGPVARLAGLYQSNISIAAICRGRCYRGARGFPWFVCFLVYCRAPYAPHRAALAFRRNLVLLAPVADSRWRPAGGNVKLFNIIFCCHTPN
jgi:cell division protein FtsX